MAGDEEDFKEKLRKAFADLQTQVVESREKQKSVEALKKAMQQNIRIASVVKNHLGVLPPGREVYRTVGRAYLMETADLEVDRQNKDIQQCEERIGKLDKQKEFIEKRLADSETSLREFVQQHRQGSNGAGSSSGGVAAGDASGSSSS